MKALGVRQPWAWLIVQGIKYVENRKWPTHYRGRFFVHANKAVDEAEVSQLRTELATKGINIPLDLPTGGIVSIVTLVDCIQYLSWPRRILCRLLRNRPAYCVDQPDSVWFEGPYGFILQDARPLPFKPFSGKQQFFNVPDDLYGPEIEI